MYKINLYPEYAERRRQRQSRLALTAILTAAVGLEALLVFALGLSGRLLEERAAGLRSEVKLTRSAMESGGSPGAELEIAREMMQVRLQRADWSPKLAALSERMPDGLRLQEVSAHATGNAGGARMEIVGVVRAGTADMQAVSQLLGALTRDRRVASSLPEIKLGTLETGGTGRFRIICDAVKKEP